MAVTETKVTSYQLRHWDDLELKELSTIDCVFPVSLSSRAESFAFLIQNKKFTWCPFFWQTLDSKNFFQWFSWTGCKGEGAILHSQPTKSGNIWQYVETIWLPQLGKCYWHLVDRRQVMLLKILQITGHTHTANNYLAPNVDIAEV